MTWLILLAVLGGILFLAARSLREMGRRERESAERAAAAKAPAGPPPSPPLGPPPVAATPPTEAEAGYGTAQALAQALHPLYEGSSHPQDLLDAPEFDEGVAELSSPRFSAEQLIDYALGANHPLAAMAAEALARRDDGAPAVPALLPYLRQANVWTVFYILRVFLRHARGSIIAPVLRYAPEWWPRNPLMPRILGQFIEARLEQGEQPDLRAELEAHPDVEPAALEATIACLQPPLAATLRGDLRAWQGGRLDVSFLNTIGRVWREGAAEEPVIEHPRLQAGIDTALQAIEHAPPQSFLVIGEAGTGKTALIRALGARLQQRGWTVFQASATDVLAGQTFIGELEKRIHDLTTHLQSGKRVVWYVPNFHELYYAGRHRFSPVGVLDMLLPAIENGQLCVIGEAQPQALEKVLQQRSRLRQCFRSLTLEPLPADETIRLAAQYLEREFKPRGVDCEEGVLREAVELARHYLSNRAAPGNLLDLLRESRSRLQQREPGQRRFSRAELLATLSQLTGLPRSVLDDREGLDPAGLRSFFEQHVMGQPEAVDCLVDRVAMLKAGLTDPNRPIGVFFFAGPTGTGKTEVAKSLAEFLFGSAERMIRLDMSEFQEPGALARIVGEAGESSEMNALTNRIRKQPFSVVLLDEFEKAHPRVWDLFLQVFDDGRLTDAQGGLADFRHCIIILTSNVGATQHQGSSLGFTSGAGSFGEAQVTRAISQTFRPEFVNRLDRVVVFRPLSKSVMREILKKELRSVMGRRGFRYREWAVEWEDSAIEFLLEKGFTPDMGARPLRRAIDRYVLAPIAMTIVEHRFPEGDQFLFVRSDGSALEVEFVDPDAPVAPRPAAAAGALTLAEIILSARGSEAERAFLEAAVGTLGERLEAPAWVGWKDGLLRQMRRASFWDDPDRHAVLQKIEAMDAVEAGADTARSLMRRLSARQRGAPPVLLSNLAQQLYLIEAALEDLDTGESSDVFIGIERFAVDGRGASVDARASDNRRDGEPDWPRQLADMYLAWGRKRHMRMQVLADGAPWAASASGPGARAILAKEAGLHVFEVPAANGGFDRLVARVRVAAQPAAPRPPQSSAAAHALACLSATAADTAIVRRYRAQPSPLVRDAHDGWRTGRLDLVLGGDFDLMQQRLETA
jgi:ATP-dependent Clp protease ATP-binding subunit ClpC